ncbi:hypothetical protein ACTFIY_004417 [Dictyostelium cf. discoideum]
MQNKNNYSNKKYKIVLFGDYWDFNSMEKKSFKRFGDDDDDDDDDELVKIKTEFRIKNIEFKDTCEKFELFIYDVNEYSESFIYFKDFYFKSVDGYILVYNPLNNSYNNSFYTSFEILKKWLTEIKKSQTNNNNNNNWKDWFNIYSWLNWFSNKNNNNNNNNINSTATIIIVLDKTHLKDNDPEYEKIKILANDESIQLIEITNSKESTNKMYFQLTKLIHNSQ